MQIKALGYYGEEIAGKYLVSKEYKILSRNFTVKGGEIDIVASKNNEIVFVEVKTRKSNTFGRGEESVNSLKKYRMRRAINRYLSMKKAWEMPYRIDLVEIELFRNGELKHLEHFEDVGV